MKLANAGGESDWPYKGARALLNQAVCLCHGMRLVSHMSAFALSPSSRQAAVTSDTESLDSHTVPGPHLCTETKLGGTQAQPPAHPSSSVGLRGAGAAQPPAGPCQARFLPSDLQCAVVPPVLAPADLCPPCPTTGVPSRPTCPSGPAPGLLAAELMPHVRALAVLHPRL